jgi:death-on-curing protein
MNKLAKIQILDLHTEQITKYGGRDGIHDDGLLESALAAPYQEFDGQEIFPTILQKAVRLGFGLIKNHPFIDGNKRVGTHAMLITLDLNGIELNYNEDELYKIITEVASGKAIFNQLLCWVRDHQIKQSL